MHQERTEHRLHVAHVRSRIHIRLREVGVRPGLVPERLRQERMVPRGVALRHHPQVLGVRLLHPPARNAIGPPSSTSRAAAVCCIDASPFSFWTSGALNHAGGATASPASSSARSCAVIARTRVPPWRRMRRLAASSAILLHFGEAWNCQPSVKIATSGRLGTASRR